MNSIATQSKDTHSPLKSNRLRLFVRATLRILFFLLLVGLLLIAYITHIEPYWLDVAHVDVPVANLPPELAGFTIVHLSDIHYGLEPGERLLPTAISISNAQQPDIVVLTGDFVDANSLEDAQLKAQQVAQQLSTLQSQQGTYAILGNHDLWDKGAIVAQELQHHDIQVLRHERVAIETKGTRVWLIGIEDVDFIMCHTLADFQKAYSGYEVIIQELLAGLPPDELQLLLVHNPDLVTLLPDASVDLLFGGHTHGGYGRLPSVGALATTSCYGQQWLSGLVKHEQTWMYINRGLGGLPMRLGTRPEITILHLTPP